MSETRTTGAIRIGKRHRKQLGDVAALARSIEEVGLLHPIVVTPKGRLIAGERRLTAVKLLGWEEVPVTVVDVNVVLGEYAENVERKQFTPSECVAIYRNIKDKVATPRGRPTKEKVENFHHNGKTRDKVGKYCGVSGRTLEKMVEIVEAAEDEPEKYQHLVDGMDRTGSVQRYFNIYKRSSVGRHLTNKFQGKVINGDAAEVLPTFKAESFDAIITDPAWNVGQKYNGKYIKAVSPETWWQWFEPIYQQMLRVLRPGGFLAIWQPQKHFPYFWQWFGQDIHIYASCKQNVPRNRTLPIGYGYDPIVLRWKKGPVKYPHPRPSMLDWFVCPGGTEGIGGGNELSRLHPCPRSLAQVESLVLNFTMPGAKILDPFSGSGTMGVAVANCGEGRKATLIEIDQDYCRLAEERMEQRR